MTVRVRLQNTSATRRRAERAAERAVEIVMGELSAAFQQSLEEEVWSWPRETRRVNGEIVSSPRNIIDTGTLKRSHSWKMTGRFQATFRWSAHYATGVHEGAFVAPWAQKNGAGFTGAQRRVYLPPRPWTGAVMGTQPVTGITPFPLDQRLRNVWMTKFREK
jgi:hypothetical protein